MEKYNLLIFVFIPHLQSLKRYLRVCFAVWGPCVPRLAGNFFLLFPDLFTGLLHKAGTWHIGLIPSTVGPVPTAEF